MSQVLSQAEERARVQRELTERAIQMALESKWEEAVAVNRQLLAMQPRDARTLNRLGKALSETGSYADARKAYADALALDPTNTIAQKNLERLGLLTESSAAARPSERIDPRLFIEETGKTGFTNLVDLAAPAVLARLTAGDQAYLHVEEKALYVRNAAGETLGRVEPHLANRLIKFINGGNQYAAAITDIGDAMVRVIIRETFQHPSLIGRVSFPPQQAGKETVRAYIKDSMLRYSREEEDDESSDEDGEYPDAEESTEELAESELEESESREMEE